MVFGNLGVDYFEKSSRYGVEVVVRNDELGYFFVGRGFVGFDGLGEFEVGGVNVFFGEVNYVFGYGGGIEKSLVGGIFFVGECFENGVEFGVEFNI